MKSFRVQFFATREETIEAVSRCAVGNGLRIRTFRHSDGRLGSIDVGALSASGLMDIDRLFASSMRSAPEELLHSIASGQTIVDLPRREQDRLTMGEVSLKTDPEDDVNRSVFQALSKEIRRILVTPTVVRNVVSGDERLLREVRCSSLAIALSRSGVQLKQHAVRNTVFLPLVDR